MYEKFIKHTSVAFKCDGSWHWSLFQDAYQFFGVY